MHTSKYSSCLESLTLSMLGKKNQQTTFLKIPFLNFPGNRVRLLDSLYRISDPISLKIRKLSLVLSFAEFSQRVLGVK